MSLRVVVTKRAQAQIDEADQWRRENTAHPDLLASELTAAVRILIHHPDTGSPFPQARQRGIRAYLLRRTQHIVFYRVDLDARTVRILALWHTARGSGPPL